MAKFYHFTTSKALEGIFSQGQPDWLFPVYRNYDLARAADLDAAQIAAIERELLHRGAAYIDGDCVRGLWPSKNFIPLGSATHIENPRINHPVIEGVCEPIPKGWIDDQYNLLADLFSDICTSSKLGKTDRKLILLELETTDCDEVYVVDWALARNHMGTEQSISQAADKYWNSRVSLDKYTGKEGFKWPVVVCWNPIPPERIKVAFAMEVSPMTSKNEVVEQYKTQWAKAQQAIQCPNGKISAASFGSP